MQKTISKSTKMRSEAAYIHGSPHPKRKVIQKGAKVQQWKEVVEHEIVFSISLNKNIIRSRTRHIPASNLY